jgi:hypothetical protein
MARFTVLFTRANHMYDYFKKEPVIEEIIRPKQLMLPLLPGQTIRDSTKDDLLAIIESSLAPWA